MELATPRAWAERRSSLQPLSTKRIPLTKALSIIVRAVDSGLRPVDEDRIKCISSNVQSCLRAAQAVGLIQHTGDHWIVTDDGASWINSQDIAYLSACVCQNVQFTGELLNLLDEPMTDAELLKIAVDSYGMRWESTAQIRERIKWFEALGLITRDPDTHVNRLSGKGADFLESIHPTTLEEVANDYDFGDDDTWLPDDWALDLCKMTEGERAGRRVPMNRLPGGADRVIELLSDTVSYCKQPKNISEMNERLSSLGIRSGSADAYRSVVQRFGLIEFSSGGYRSTNDGIMWNETKRAINLACYMDSVLAFSFEILQALSSEESNKQRLITTAKEVYGINLTKDGLGFRINVLRAANLIRTDRNAIGITRRGRQLLELIPTNATAGNVGEEGGQSHSHEPKQPTLRKDLLDLIIELKESATDSHHSERFEEACTRAFNFLGFETKHIGGSGDTDVLVEGQSGTKDSYRIVVDAKSSSSGSVDQNIDFAALKSHRTKHDASHSLVIGAKFGNATLQEEYAHENNVLMIDVDTLCELVKSHADVPISTREYRYILNLHGRVTWDDLKGLFDKSGKTQVLMRYIMNTLSSQTVLDVYGGVLTPRDFITSMIGPGSSPVFATDRGIPTESEIESVLSFLSHPLVGVVAKEDGGYCKVASSKDLSTKLKCYINGGS